MLGYQNTVMRFNTGFIPGLKAFTAAVLGGIGNVPGAMIGAIILGELEALGPSLLGLPNEYKDVIAFSVLIFVLIFGRRVSSVKDLAGSVHNHEHQTGYSLRINQFWHSVLFEHSGPASAACIGRFWHAVAGVILGCTRPHQSGHYA